MHHTSVERVSAEQLVRVHEIYEDARAIQIAQNSAVWPPFTDEKILREIANGELYAVVANESMLGVFSLIESDPLLGGDDETGEHLYLHRIARSNDAASSGFIDTVINWSLDECQRRGRKGVRMDTWGSNKPLIALYEKRGFRLVDARRMPADPRLSPHYHGIVLALLEAPCALGS